jgi:hypothetical protein
MIKAGAILRCVLRILTSKITEGLECYKIRDYSYMVAGYCNVTRLPYSTSFEIRLPYYNPCSYAQIVFCLVFNATAAASVCNYAAYAYTTCI